MAIPRILALALLSSVAVAAPKPGANYGCPPASTITKTVTAPASTVTVTSGAGSGSVTSSGSSSSTNTNPTTTETATYTSVIGLNDYARATGKLYFGSAPDIPGVEQQDVYYIAELENPHDWGQMTPANCMKWEFTEPEQGVFNYTEADEFLAYANEHDHIVRCHNLNWYNELPTWLTNPTTPWTNETLIAVLENHIKNLVTHFGTRCYCWDVVNEALSDSGTGSLADNATWRSDMWYNIIGPAYINIAFATAEKYAPPSVKLYYNDYSIEAPGNKTNAAYELVKSIKGAGIRIDGVGLQNHWEIGTVPDAATLATVMDNFVALDVEVAQTELDVRAVALPVNAANQTQQVIDYYNVVAACVQTERCVGTTTWDFCDTYSWVPSTFTGQGYADLFLQPNGPNTTLVKKAPYDGVIQALRGEPLSTP